MTKEWKDKKESFETIDVRQVTGNFLPMLLKKAEDTDVGEGICVIQTFEPIPLYPALAGFGFDHSTEKISEEKYKTYFYRKEESQATISADMDAPLKPIAIPNIYKAIDNSLAKTVVNFWKLVWEQDDPAIEDRTKYLLSLANGVGARRFRQATRELIKGYAAGVTVAELDELFLMFAWNEGIGTFSSEISTSPLFDAYRLIKKLENKDRPRKEIVKKLVDKFGEKNPEVGFE